MLAPGFDIRGEYRVEGWLGQGGMATVYLVRHLETGVLYALKVLNLSIDSYRARFQQEGEIQRTLRHENILAVNKMLEVNHFPGLISEYIDGPSLAQLLDHKRLTFAQVDALARGILSGVAEAHRHGIVHRDLKPQNILLKRDEERFIPKIADFGIAKALLDGHDSAMTHTGQMMGSPWYMAPEQVRNAKKLDHRADIWALGVIFYEMLSGVRPFQHEDRLVCFQRIDGGEFTPLQALTDPPAAMCSAIERAMRVDMDERWDSVEEMLSAWIGDRTEPEPSWPAELLAWRPAGREPPLLSDASMSEDDTTGSWRHNVLQRVRRSKPAEPPPPLPAPARRHRLSVGFFLGLAVAGGISGVLWVSPPKEPPAPIEERPQPQAVPPAQPLPVTQAPLPVPTAPIAPPPQPPKPPRPSPPSDVLLVVKSLPIATVAVSINGSQGGGEKRGRIWEFRVPEGEHHLELRSADGRTGHSTLQITGDTTHCWDYDTDDVCAP